MSIQQMGCLACGTFKLKFQLLGRVSYYCGLLYCLSALLLLLGGCTIGKGNLKNPNPDLATIQRRGYLIVGTNYGGPPFGEMRQYDNKPPALEGIDIELSREIAARLFARSEFSHPSRQPNLPTIEFRQVLTSTRLVALNTQSVDLVAAAMTITPEREQLVAFSIPYFTVHQAVLLPERSPIQHTSQLHGKVILTVNGSAGQGRIHRLFPKSRIVGYSSLKEAYTALKAGYGDAMTNDDILLLGLLAQESDCGKGHRFRLLKQTLSTEPYGLAFQKSADAQNGLLTAVNGILSQLRRDGQLETIIQRGLNKKIHHPLKRTGCLVPST